MKFIKKLEETIIDLGSFYGDWYSDLLAKIYVFFSFLFSLILAYFLYTESNHISAFNHCHDLVVFNHFLCYTIIFMSVKSYLVFKFNKTFQKEDFTEGLVFNWHINTFFSLVSITWFLNKFISFYEHEHCDYLQYLGCICIMIDIISWLFQMYLIKKFVEFDRLFSKRGKFLNKKY